MGREPEPRRPQSTRRPPLDEPRSREERHVDQLTFGHTLSALRDLSGLGPYWGVSIRAPSTRRPGPSFSASPLLYFSTSSLLRSASTPVTPRPRLGSSLRRPTHKKTPPREAVVFGPPRRADSCGSKLEAADDAEAEAEHQQRQAGQADQRQLAGGGRQDGRGRDRGRGRGLHRDRGRSRLRRGGRGRRGGA